jgi:uncharacterized protein YutE (UPF0331/DUF86 family)
MPGKVDFNFDGLYSEVIHLLPLVSPPVLGYTGRKRKQGFKTDVKADHIRNLLHPVFEKYGDSCISLAELTIKKQALKPPQSYHEAFDTLGESRILEREFAYRFARIAGSRNLLAHDYEKVAPTYICEGILSGLP